MSKEAYKGTVRLTVAQAIIRFLSNQYTERDASSAASSRALWHLRPRQRCWHRSGAPAERDRPV